MLGRQELCRGHAAFAASRDLPVTLIWQPKIDFRCAAVGCGAKATHAAPPYLYTCGPHSWVHSIEMLDCDFCGCQAVAKGGTGFYYCQYCLGFAVDYKIFRYIVEAPL